VIKNAEDVKKLGTIMSLWAHPDDETFSAAGLLSMAGINGQRVICVTSTRGGKGTQDETKWPKKDLEKIRTNEMIKSLAYLGDIEHEWLNYKDGECESVNINEATKSC